MKKIKIKCYQEIKPHTILTEPIEGKIVNEGGRTFLVTII